MRTHTLGFVLEQALGHRTHSNNLRINVPKDDAVEALWAEIPFEVEGLAARLPLYSSNWTVRAGLRARRAVAQMQRQHGPIDALFFHTQVPAVLATNWVRRLPSVVSLDATPRQYDELGQFYQHEQGPAWLEDVKWRLNRRCFDSARHLVTWSRWAKQGLIDDYGVAADKITVIPPGVNATAWARPSARTAFAQPAEPVKILFVGGDLARKGGLLLLDAFRALRDEQPGGTPVELHLVTREAVEMEPGLFVYNDMQPNSEPLKQLFHRCDMFCLPTYGDCLAMVLSEAGAAEMPLVTTKVGGLPEIAHHEETGLLVPIGSVPALIEALRRLIVNPTERMEMGQRARALVQREFDAEQNTVKLLTLLKRVADAPQYVASPREQTQSTPV